MHFALSWFYSVALILAERSKKEGRDSADEFTGSYKINSGGEVCVLAKHGYIGIIVYTNRKWPVYTAMIAPVRYRYNVFKAVALATWRNAL